MFKFIILFETFHRFGITYSDVAMGGRQWAMPPPLVVPKH